MSSRDVASFDQGGGQTHRGTEVSLGRPVLLTAAAQLKESGQFSYLPFSRIRASSCVSTFVSEWPALPFDATRHVRQLSIIRLGGRARPRCGFEGCVATSDGFRGRPPIHSSQRPPPLRLCSRANAEVAKRQNALRSGSRVNERGRAKFVR